MNDRVIKTIGLIGAGHIGSQIARLAVRNNYNVVISNSRGPGTLSALVAELGPKARAATAADAARAGDIVVVTVPLKNYRAVPVEPLAEKIVIDTNNYYGHPSVRSIRIRHGGCGTAEGRLAYPARYARLRSAAHGGGVAPRPRGGEAVRGPLAAFRRNAGRKRHDNRRTLRNTCAKPGRRQPFSTFEEASDMQLVTVAIDKPEATNFILGQTHFIKSVEDLHEALVACVPGIKFGLAFCEASGKCLVRWSGTDPAMIELAQKNANSLGAGHCFIIFLGDGFYPVNVLNTIKMVPEVCRVFCATANPTEVILAETQQGRGILGVVDGCPPKGIEGDDDIAWRKNLLRQIGYKL
jgi:adenosine/AMP kinase